MTELKPLWRDNLIHMLGCGKHVPKRQHGHRNRFCASISLADEDYALMLEMESAGLVKSGIKINDGMNQLFFATELGCKAIGMSAAAIKRAMVL